MKKTLLTITALAAMAVGAQAQLIITGVVDGNESGGIPKGAELYAQTAIADLSIYSIGRYTNGGSTLSSVTALPSISLAAGDFFYLTGTTTSDAFFTGNGFTVGLSNQSVVNINGDDLLTIVLSSDGVTAVDTFGLPGQGDTNFYENSIAYRLSTNVTANPTGQTDASPGFAITAWVDSADFGDTFGTYDPVPEPSTAILLGGTCLLWVVRRRRSAQA